MVCHFLDFELFDVVYIVIVNVDMVDKYEPFSKKTAACLLVLSHACFYLVK